MATTENYRVTVCLDALQASVQRIEYFVRNDGSLSLIAQECACVQEFHAAVNRADSDDEITELVSVRNS